MAQEKKKLGLKCCFGLTALCPKVFDTVAKVDNLHQLQMNTAEKIQPNQFNLSDKKMNILILETFCGGKKEKSVWLLLKKDVKNCFKNSFLSKKIDVTFLPFC